MLQKDLITEIIDEILEFNDEIFDIDKSVQDSKLIL